MKLVKMLIATVALSGALVTTAHARDSFSIGVNIGGFDHFHSLRTHRYAPVYYGHYYSAPPVVYYAPPIRYRHFRQDAYYGGRHFDNGRRFNRRGNDYDRGHRDRDRGRRGWR
jgi:hypothetical protein